MSSTPGKDPASSLFLFLNPEKEDVTGEAGLVTSELPPPDDLDFPEFILLFFR